MSSLVKTLIWAVVVVACQRHYHAAIFKTTSYRRPDVVLPLPKTLMEPNGNALLMTKTPTASAKDLISSPQFSFDSFDRSHSDTYNLDERSENSAHSHDAAAAASASQREYGENGSDVTDNVRVYWDDNSDCTRGCSKQSGNDKKLQRPGNVPTLILNRDRVYHKRDRHQNKLTYLPASNVLQVKANSAGPSSRASQVSDSTGPSWRSNMMRVWGRKRNARFDTGSNVYSSES